MKWVYLIFAATVSAWTAVQMPRLSSSKRRVFVLLSRQFCSFWRMVKITTGCMRHPIFVTYFAHLRKRSWIITYDHLFLKRDIFHPFLRKYFSRRRMNKQNAISSSIDLWVKLLFVFNHHEMITLHLFKHLLRSQKDLIILLRRLIQHKQTSSKRWVVSPTKLCGKFSIQDDQEKMDAERSFVKDVGVSQVKKTQFCQKVHLHHASSSISSACW